MKTLNKTILGASAVALTVALGVTTVSALSFGAFFDSFFQGDAKTSVSADASASANTNLDARGTGNTNASSEVQGSSQADASSDLGLLNTGADVQGDIRIESIIDTATGLPYNPTTTVTGDYDMNAAIDTDVHASVFSRIVAWFKSLFSFGADTSADANVNAQGNVDIR